MCGRNRFLLAETQPWIFQTDGLRRARKPCCRNETVQCSVCCLHVENGKNSIIVFSDVKFPVIIILDDDIGLVMMTENFTSENTIVEFLSLSTYCCHRYTCVKTTFLYINDSTVNITHRLHSYAVQVAFWVTMRVQRCRPV